MQFYSDIKKDEIMTLAGKWMELGIIMFSKISQVQKTKFQFSSSCEVRPKR
jgi:hypothetical protein